MIHSPNNWVLFLGRFHPLLVHLPIGSLVLLGFLELLARLGLTKDGAQNNRLILGFVWTSTLAAVACGWLLAQTGGYSDTGLLAWHRWLGVGFLFACLITFMVRSRGWIRPYRIFLSITLLLLLVEGHLGGSITHGRDYLTDSIPLFSLDRAKPQPPHAILQAALEQPVFSGVVQPILRQHCVSCHNAQKHKADLRLDSFQALLAGGVDGPVIKAGHSEESGLIQCLLSPPDADGHMPPEDQPQLTARDIMLLEWWIDAGAPADRIARDLNPSTEITRLLEARSEPTSKTNQERVPALDN